jgi:hypothetical protein
VRRRAALASEPAPRDRKASVDEMAAYLRDNCFHSKTPLEVEINLSAFLIFWGTHPDELGDGPWTLVGRDLFGAIERAGDAGALIALRGFAAVTGGDLAEASSAAAERLARRGVELPARLAEIGQAQALAAWRMKGDGFENEAALVVEFGYPAGARHALTVFVDRHRRAKHVAVCPPAAVMMDGREDEFEPVDVGRASSLIAAALDASDPFYADGEGLTTFGALAWARVQPLAAERS